MKDYFAKMESIVDQCVVVGNLVRKILYFLYLLDLNLNMPQSYVALQLMDQQINFLLRRFKHSY